MHIQVHVVWYIICEQSSETETLWHHDRMTLDTLRMTCCSYKKYILLSMVIILPHGWDNNDNDNTKFNKEYLNFLNSSHI